MLIALYTPTNTQSLEVAGVRDAFFKANELASRPLYETWVISETRDPVRCASGMLIVPDRTIEEARGPVDTVMVMGTEGIPDPPSPAVIDWIKAQASSARRFGSVCTGAFIAGAAGLLDGKHVTTHWAFAEALAEAFPTAKVESDCIFLRDGKLISSAGASAAIDLALALIEEDHGRSLALSVAQSMVIYLKRPGGQSQFSTQLAAQAATRGPIEDVQQWIRDHPVGDLSLPELASRAAMSVRNFSRVFVQETGMTPADFVQLARLDAARGLLEDSSHPTQRIASLTGFSSSSALTRAFIKRLGITPAEYRARFRSTRR